MFWKNDGKMLMWRALVCVALIVCAVLGMLAGLMLSIDGEWIGIVWLLVAPLAAWIGWVFWEFVFSVCVDIKFIRNKLYGEPLAGMEEFCNLAAEDPMTDGETPFGDPTAEPQGGNGLEDTAE